MPKASLPREVEVTIDRRRPATAGQAPVAEAAQIKPPRRKKERRRQIDPTTCERDYSAEEIDFMQAMDAYKRSSGRMFPTCSEVLEVIRGLGYVKLSDEEKQVLASIEAVEAEMADALEGAS